MTQLQIPPIEPGDKMVIWGIYALGALCLLGLLALAVWDAGTR